MSREISDDDVRRLGNKCKREEIRIPIPKQAFAEDTPSTSYHHHDIRFDPESGTFIQDDYEQESILENINKEIRIIRDEQRSLVDEYHRQNRLLFIIAILPILYVAILLIMMFTAK